MAYDENSAKSFREAKAEILDRTDGPLTAYVLTLRAAKLCEAGRFEPEVVADAYMEAMEDLGVTWPGVTWPDDVETGS